MKGITAGVVGAVLLFIGQQWLNSDLEYKVTSRDGYLSAPLGEQGLTFSYDGKPLNNVSLVEFGIHNRTSKQFNDVTLMFSIDDPKGQFRLVSGGILTPSGISRVDTIEEIPTKAPYTKSFLIKVIPKQKHSEFFHAVFVFDGDKAPKMSVVSLSKDAPIGSYHQWKDETKFLLITIGVVFIFIAVMVFIGTFIDYFAEPRNHRRQVEKFTVFAQNMKEEGKLKSNDSETLSDAGVIYAAYTRPQASRFWSKIFGNQNFE